MSKAKQELIDILSAKHGHCAAALVDELYTLAALDDSICRRAVVVAKYRKMLATTRMSSLNIMQHLADWHGMSVGAIKHTLAKT